MRTMILRKTVRMRRRLRNNGTDGNTVVVSTSLSLLQSASKWGVGNEHISTIWAATKSDNDAKTVHVRSV